MCGRDRECSRLTISGSVSGAEPEFLEKHVERCVPHACGEVLASSQI
jgi:hypothetical protein